MNWDMAHYIPYEKLLQLSYKVTSGCVLPAFWTRLNCIPNASVGGMFTYKIALCGLSAKFCADCLHLGCLSGACRPCYLVAELYHRI